MFLNTLYLQYLQPYCIFAASSGMNIASSIGTIGDSESEDSEMGRLQGIIYFKLMFLLA